MACPVRMLCGMLDIVCAYVPFFPPRTRRLACSSCVNFVPPMLGFIRPTVSDYPPLWGERCPIRGVRDVVPVDDPLHRS